jgi:hypothetical protein
MGGKNLEVLPPENAVENSLTLTSATGLYKFSREPNQLGGFTILLQAADKLDIFLTFRSFWPKVINRGMK